MVNGVIYKKDAGFREYIIQNQLCTRRPTDMDTY